MYNTPIGPVTVNGRDYTKFYAWLPVKSTLAGWVWFNYYYIRPDQYFEGRLLSQAEFLQETASDLEVSG